MASFRLRQVLSTGFALGRRQSFIVAKSLRTFSAVKCFHSPNLEGRRSLSTQAEQGVYKSPFPDVEIPEDVNLAHYVMEDFHKRGNKIAFVEGVSGKEMTYAQLQDQIIKVGSALVKEGFKKGDVITIFSPNCPEFAVMYLAVAAIGGVVSAVNPLYTPSELQHAVSHSESKLLVTVPLLLPVAQKAATDCPSLKEVVVFGQAQGCRPFASYLQDDGSHFPQHLATDAKRDLVALPYSSGTTGLPKGVELTHYNIIANLMQMRTPNVMNYEEEEVLIGVLPFFHIYGQVVVMLSALMKGITTVTMPKFDPELYLNCVQKYKGSFLHVAPPIVLFMAKHPMVDKYDLDSVRCIFTGAAPVGGEAVKEAVDRLPSKPVFRQGYGLTEASPVTHCNPPDSFKYHTVGPAIHNVQFKIVDIETGEPLEPGKEGELLVKGPNVMKGYFKNPEATAATLRDGWLHTGDIGYTDPDGHLVISDRLKELIKYKGFQVAPAELEALLVTHPAIADAAVIGLPDERAGELPRAYVVVKPGATVSAEEVQDFVKGKVASYKQLSGGVEFRSEIPKSAAGKILRRELKAELKEKMS